MNISKYRSLAYDRLSYEGEPRDVNKGIVEFMAVLCAIEDELLEFEVEVSKLDIDLTGWRSTQSLGSIEEKHSSYLQEISDAHGAVLMGHLTRLDRNPAEDHTARTQEQVPRFQDDLRSTIGRLEEISDRIGRRIDAKRSSANTRLVFTVAAIAATLSVLTLIGQFFGLIAQLLQLLY